MRLRPSQLQLSLNPSDVCCVVAGLHQCEIALRGDMAVVWQIVYGRKAQNGWLVIWGKVVEEPLGCRRKCRRRTFQSWTDHTFREAQLERSTALCGFPVLFMSYSGGQLLLFVMLDKNTHVGHLLKQGTQASIACRGICFIIQCTVLHQILPRNFSFYFIKFPLLIFFFIFLSRSSLLLQQKPCKIDSSAQLSFPSPPLPSLLSSLPASSRSSSRII